MLAVSAASAVVQNQQQNKSIEAQAEAANRNTEMQYGAAQAQQQQVDAQAFEQRTDRARQAARQLAQARVIAAQGGGSLAANAINITGAAAEDLSRIDVSAANQKATIRGQAGNAYVQGQTALDGLAAQSSANTVNTGLTLATGAAQAGSTYYNNVQAEKTAKNFRNYLTVKGS